MRTGASVCSDNLKDAKFNMGTGIAGGPGQANLYPALSGTIAFNRLSEKSSLEFRAEFYNELNHPQFSNSDTNFTSQTFGVIGSTAVNERVRQLALKYSF